MGRSNNRSRLSETQLIALERIGRGEVVVRYGAVTEGQVANNTLYSLEERGFIHDTNKPNHSVRLSPFGYQFTEGWFD